MSTDVETVVVGGGAMGLSVGYNLLKMGMKTIVLEGDYLNAGSTGRNMGILKERIPHAMGRGNEDLIRIARKGLQLHSKLSTETGINTFYRKSGCLTIAKNEEELKQLEEYQSHFHNLGLRDDFLSPEEIHSKWPYIDASGLLGGFYSPEEAMAHPFGVVWAYVESIKKMKGTIEKQNKVKTIRRSARGYKIEAEKGEYQAENVVIACAAHSSELSKQLGFEVPLTPLRKEVLISEAMRPFFGPAIERLSEDYQIAQTMRGEVLGTMGYMSPGFDLSECTSGFLNRFADETVQLIPAFRHLRIIRQWTGICDKTPDEKPIVGAIDDGLYITCGHYDYGINLAPIVGQLLADSIIKASIDLLLKPFDPHRFN
jgi:sarcosine oxidase subunit beta